MPLALGPTDPSACKLRPKTTETWLSRLTEPSRSPPASPRLGPTEQATGRAALPLLARNRTRGDSAADAVDVGEVRAAAERGGIFLRHALKAVLVVLAAFVSAKLSSAEAISGTWDKSISCDAWRPPVVSLLSLWIGFAAHPKFYVYLLPSVPRCAIINAKQTGLLAFPYSPHIPIALGRLHTRPLFTLNIPNPYAAPASTIPTLSHAPFPSLCASLCACLGVATC